MYPFRLVAMLKQTEPCFECGIEPQCLHFEEIDLQMVYLQLSLDIKLRQKKENTLAHTHKHLGGHTYTSVINLLVLLLVNEMAEKTTEVTLPPLYAEIEAQGKDNKQRPRVTGFPPRQSRQGSGSPSLHSPYLLSSLILIKPLNSAHLQQTNKVAVFQTGHQKNL